MRERKKNRLQAFDYSSNNLYFVTSLVKDRLHHFGNIVENKMELNNNGQIAQNQWEWLIKQYPYIKSHAFVVMPNHIHGILEINSDFLITGRDIEAGYEDADVVGAGRNVVGTGRDLSLQQRKQIKIKSLSELMGAYKTTTSKKIHLLGNENFAWQRSFHDHIIRNNDEYEKIISYIYNNPQNWKDDNFFNEAVK